MLDFMDKVHVVGMSEGGSTYMTVTEYSGADNKTIRLEPPVKVVLEGENAHVAVVQGNLAARYHDDELRQIGEGSSTLGLKRVIGDIAMNGNIAYGDPKPMHPNFIDADIVSPLELTASQREIIA